MPSLIWRPDWSDSFGQAVQASRQEIVVYQVPAAMTTTPPTQPPDDLLRTILAAQSAYITRARDNPVALLISPQDWRRLLAANNAGRPLVYEPGGASTVFGMEVRVERSMAPGQVMVLGVNDSVVQNWGGDLVGVLTSNEARRRAGIASRSPNVLNPEDQVLDDIDLLVNDQVRPGPQDDYNVDRYPKCEACGHDWHGLDCVGGCDCVNTEWLKNPRTAHLDFGKAPVAAPSSAPGRQLDL